MKIIPVTLEFLQNSHFTGKQIDRQTNVHLNVDLVSERLFFTKRYSSKGTLGPA